MSIQIDWARNPISVKSQDLERLSIFLNFLKSNGVKKHSILMPDRETSGHIFFIYENIDQNIMEKWNKERD